MTATVQETGTETTTARLSLELDADTLARAQAAGISLPEHIARHDAYGFFQALGDLVVTGPTRTNVNDYRVILLLPEAARG